MVQSITHTKVSAIADGTDAAQVQPSDWNADHTLTDVATGRHEHIRVEPATILDLANLSPLVLISSPGPGRFIRVLNVMWALSNPDSNTYTVDPPNVNLMTLGAQVSYADVAFVLMADGVTMVDSVAPYALAPTELDSLEDSPVVLQSAGTPSGGTGQLDIWIDFQVLAMPVVD